MDKVVAPNMIVTLWAQPNARSVIQPKPSFLWLFHWNFQPLSSPQPFHPLVIHMPPGISQQRRDPTIAVSTILPGQLDHIRHQSLFVWAADRCFALCGSVLPHDAASYIQRVANTINASTATSGA